MMLLIYIVGGISLLFIGGEILVRGAVALAKHFNISVLVIGLTVVAFATSAPELFINIQSILNGYSDIAIGNVIGSNISNTLLVLGSTALIYPVVAHNKIILQDIFILLIISVIVHLFCWTGLILSSFEGWILCAIIVSYSVFRIYYERSLATASVGNDEVAEITNEIEDEVGHIPITPVWQSALYIVIGIIMLKFGADYFVEGAVSLARMIGISEAVIGLTLIAVGSSAPELAISIIAAFRKHSDLVIGNIIGSNIFNFASVLGITSVLHPVTVSPGFVYSDLFILFGFTLLLLAVIYWQKAISRQIGAVFLISYGIYVSSLLY